MTPSPDFLRGVRAGLEAAAKVADALDRKDRDDNIGEWHTADYGIACRALARSIRAIDPTTVGGDHG